MKQRILSGAVLVAVFAAMILCGSFFPPIITAVVAFIAASCIFEVVRAIAPPKGKTVLLVSSMILAAVVPFCCAYTTLLLAYFLYTVVFFCILLRIHSTVSFQRVSVLYGMALMIPTALKCLVDIFYEHKENGMFYLTLAMWVALIADVGAYFAGSFFGKHKLCPSISPKKTVEGVIGGIVLNILVAVLYAWLYALYCEGACTVHYGYVALLALLAAPVSVLGDLSFSLFKRSVQIKDFGTLIPGHGGMLDRFDSVIFVAPFAYLFAHFLTLVTRL